MFNLETLRAVCIVVERSWLAPAVITVRVMNAQINRNFFQRPGIHGDLLISSLWPVKLGRMLIGLSACVCVRNCYLDVSRSLGILQQYDLYYYWRV